MQADDSASKGRLMGQALRKEIETFQQHLPELIKQEGKFALVHEDKVIGVFDTYQDALQCGYEKHGLAPFLVKRISAIESVSYFTRDLN